MSDHDKLIGADEESASVMLIDALYAEGDRANELRAQLSSDDALRIDGFAELRRIYAHLPQQEPPARLGAQLLAAATAEVSTPREDTVERERRGFWASLMRPFIANPAFAAAAGLVVVVGTIGLLYTRGEQRIAEPSLASAPSAADEAPSPTPEGARATEPQAASSGLDVGDLSQGFADDNARGPAPEPAAPPPQAKAGRERSPSSSAKSGESYRGSGGGGVADGLLDGDAPTGSGFFGEGGSVRGANQAPAQEPAPPPPPVVSEKKAPAPPNEPADKEPSSDVKRLYDIAMREAKAGRCSKVKALLSRIRALDAGFYERRCSKEPVLQDCLRPPSKKRATKIKQSL